MNFRLLNGEFPFPPHALFGLGKVLAVACRERRVLTFLSLIKGILETTSLLRDRLFKRREPYVPLSHNGSIQNHDGSIQDYNYRDHGHGGSIQDHKDTKTIATIHEGTKNHLNNPWRPAHFSTYEEPSFEHQRLGQG
ncbi:unnamed protein product [Amaranthus hypochondriacus]